MTLSPIDKNEVSVVSMLEKAKVWLDTAVATTGPEEIAAAKAQIRTAEVYAKELHLSKAIQDDAAEMVRRAEYALGKSIRQGQAEGTVRTPGEKETVYNRWNGQSRQTGITKPSPMDFASESELSGRGDDGIYALAEATPEQFNTALEEAREEGNLARRNVVRKIKGQKSEPPLQTRSREERADLIEDLAAQGYSSRQMPAKVGVSEESVRQIARDFGIEIPADRSVGRTRRVNSTQVVIQTATALEGLVMGIELVDFDALDAREVGQWTASLTESIQKLRSFNRALGKAIQ